jgi:hypothetical protein
VPFADGLLGKNSRPSRQSGSPAGAIQTVERTDLVITTLTGVTRELNPLRPGEGIEHRLENATMGWLLFGRLLFGVGWLVGVNRLWRSPTWSRSEKLLAGHL